MTAHRLLELLEASIRTTRRAPGVLLDASMATEQPVWVQVARAGTYKGHMTGEFTFDQGVFEDVVRNLRQHPSYQVGADGWGQKDVVAWDFHHTSEQDSPGLGLYGAPAQGWVLDLDIRQGSDGVLELWALTRWLPLARKYIQENGYKWASVAVSDTVDPVSGEEIGWYLSSIALTNDPFIQGMATLTASRSLVDLIQAIKSLVEKQENNQEPIKEPKMNELLKLLVERYGIPADEEKAKAAVLRKLEAGADAETKLRAILQALGVEDVNGGMAKIAEMFKMVAQLEEAMPELSSLREAQIKSEEEDVEEDVESAMQAHRLPASTKLALRHMRTGGLVLNKDATAEQLKARAAARAAFLEAYPPAAPTETYLLASVATHPQQAAKPLAPPPAPGAGAGELKTQLDGLPGATLVEKAMTYVQAQADAKGLPFDEIHRRACELARRVR